MDIQQALASFIRSTDGDDADKASKLAYRIVDAAIEAARDDEFTRALIDELEALA